MTTKYNDKRLDCSKLIEIFPMKGTYTTDSDNSHINWDEYKKNSNNSAVQEKNLLIQKMNNSLLNMGIGDVERASNGEAKLGAFILGICMIDALSRFYYGPVIYKYKWKWFKRKKYDYYFDPLSHKEKRMGNADLFKGFIKTHFPKEYDSNKMWKDVRCGLIHAYTSGAGYAFTDANKAGNHMEQLDNKTTLLNLEDFIKHLKEAYNQLIEEIQKNDSVYKNALNWYISEGSMGLKNMSDYSQEAPHA